MNDSVPIEEAGGHRLHASGLLVGFVTGLPQLIFPIFAAIFGVRESSTPELIPVIIVAVLLISLFFRWLGWMRFRYHVAEHDIRVEKGILNRTARSIPYERIQDVSIEQKLLPRFMGLGEVKFETGSGDGDDAKLSFVTVQEANRLRELVRTRKGGVGVAISAADTDIADAPPIFAMDGRRVVLFGLYSFSLVIFAVLGGVAQQFDFLLPFDFWDFRHWVGLAEERGVSIGTINAVGLAAQFLLAFGAFVSLIFVGLATGVVRTFLRDHGFRLDRTPKGFRRRRGLFTLTDVVMPAHRVQAAVIETGPFRKRRGWYSLKFVSLAQDSKEESNFVAAPFAALEEIWPIAEAAMIGRIEPDVGFRKGCARWWIPEVVLVLPCLLAAIAALMLVTDTPFVQAAALLLLPMALGMLRWLEWRQYGDHLDVRQIYVRQGWWRQQLTVAPQVKVQSAEIVQGPISRRLGLAALKFGVSGGTLEMIALPLPTAHAIRDAVMAKVAAVDYSVINQSH